MGEASVEMDPGSLSVPSKLIMVPRVGLNPQSSNPEADPSP